MIRRIVVLFLAVFTVFFYQACAMYRGVYKPADTIRLLWDDTDPSRIMKVCAPLFVVHDAGSPELFATEVQKATEYWAALGAPLEYGGEGVYGFGRMIVPGYVIVKMEPEDSIRVLADNYQTIKAGTTAWEVKDGDCISGALVRIDGGKMESNPAEVVTIIRHEFGHVLGLGHSDWSSDLMGAVLQSDPRVHPMQASPWEKNTIRWLYPSEKERTNAQ